MCNELNYDKALVLEKQLEYIDKELKHLETQRIKEKNLIFDKNLNISQSFAYNNNIRVYYYFCVGG